MTISPQRLATTLALSVVMMLGLASCSLSVNGSSDAPTDGTMTKGQDEPQASSPTAEDTLQASGSDGLRSVMTPPGGTVLGFETQSAGDVLVLTSSDSLDALTTFYETALARLGAQKTTASGADGRWKYEGTYDGGTDIGVVMVDCDVLPAQCIWDGADLTKNGSVRLVGVAAGDGWVQFSN